MRPQCSDEINEQAEWILNNLGMNADPTRGTDVLIAMGAQVVTLVYSTALSLVRTNLHTVKDE